MNPGDILNGAGLVEVENQARGEHVGGLLADHHGAPGRVTGRLQPTFHPLRVRGERSTENEARRVNQQVHGREVESRRLVDVKVQPVSGFHLQSRLHGGIGEDAPNPVVGAMHRLGAIRNLRQLRLGIVVLLRVVVAGNPPRGMVAGHGKLGQLICYLEVSQCVLVGKLVAERQAVVVKAEANLHDGGTGNHLALPVEGTVLFQRDEQLVVVVADRGLLAPDRLPRLIERAFL